MRHGRACSSTGLSFEYAPALKALVDGEIPGFKLVYDQGLEIYQIDYALSPSD